MSDVSSGENWVWDRYWRFDRIASCFDADGSNYPPEIQWMWEEFFKTLPKGAIVLDLCTGNGAIARFAAKYAKENKKNFRVTGIDKAGIEPKKFVKQDKNTKGVTFVGGVDAAELPFEDASFDAVISQYGFEYADTRNALAEIARVTKPGGKVKMMIHAAEGVPAGNAAREIPKIRALTDELDIFTKASEATEAAWHMEKADPIARADMQAEVLPKLRAFQDAMKALARRLESDPENPVLKAPHGLLAHTFEVRRQVALDTLLDKIAETALETRAHLGRIEALLEAAVSEQQARDLLVSAEMLGFAPGAAEPFYLEDGKKLVGWNLAFSKLAK